MTKLEGLALIGLALAIAGCEARTALGSRTIDGGGRDAPLPDAPLGDAACGTIEVATRRVTPTVLLVVDQSGSMSENELGGLGVTRWDAIKSTLLDRPGGIVDRFDDRVRLGLALFSAVSTDMGEESTLIGPCPRLTEVPPALESYDAIAGVLRSADTLLETPTSDAIRALLPGLLVRGGEDPAVIVLATDGDPDTCAMPNPRTEENRRAAMEESVAAVREAHAAGVRTFVIGVGEGAVTRSHLEALANAGVGAAAGAPWWEAGAVEGLGVALEEILGAEVSCTLEVQGRVTLGQECLGTVMLDEAPLACDDADGWRLVDETHIELVGTACERFRTATSAVRASFPCGVILI